LQTPENKTKEGSEGNAEQKHSLRIHRQLRPVLLHELPQYVLRGLLKVVPAGVFREVAAEGDLQWDVRIG
jgi:hypothetical protein